MGYTLAYKDRYKRVEESLITSDTSDSVAFASIPDNIPTKLIAEWTGRQFTKLLSAVYTGANLMFPDEANEIIWQLMKVVHKPIPFELPEDSGCIEYSPSAGFIAFFPDNPYIGGDTSAGWNKEAWYTWDSFDTLFPDWIDNWISGFVGDLAGYEPTDVLFNIESIPINPIDAFLSGGGILPKIEIRFSGTGIVEVELLSFPLGGKAIIELDSEPNVLDILTGGILDPAAFLVELNRDIINFPPDEYPVNNIEIRVETAGAHVLYVVFIPITDDALIPVGFGGGFRGVELCGFEESGTVGIESIVWDGCSLKSVTGGIETTIVTAEEIQACLDIPESGGGGGVAALRTETQTQNIATAKTTTSTSFVALVGSTFPHDFTHNNALIICHDINMSNSLTNGWTYAQVTYDGSQGLDNAVAENFGQTARALTAAARFTGLISASGDVGLDFRVSSGTGTIAATTSLVFTIIEYDNIEDLFVQDVRYQDGILQKKIAGIWLDVVDIEALLEPIEAAAAAALSTATSAQSTANGAVSVNATQTAQIGSIITVNNTQNSRLEEIEDDVEDLILSVSGLNTTSSLHTIQIADLQTRVGKLDFGGVFATNQDYTDSSYFWTVLTGSGYVAGQGFRSDTNGLAISLNDARLALNPVTHVFARIYMLSAPTGSLQWRVQGGAYGSLKYNGVGTISEGWLRVPNAAGTNFQVEFLGFGDFYLRNIYFLGRGTSNPFA